MLDVEFLISEKKSCKNNEQIKESLASKVNLSKKQITDIGTITLNEYAKRKPVSDRKLFINL